MYDIFFAAALSAPESQPEETAAVCIPRNLPPPKAIQAARTAVSINPMNTPLVEALAAPLGGPPPSPEFIAVLATKWWQSGGVKLTVGFLDNPPPELRRKILSHMNAWGRSGNVEFAESNSSPQVRITRTSGSGHWSYVGTDILHINPDQPTMNLDSFTLNTIDSEFYRVVRHETGHTIGCPHEHMRRELIDKIDPEKAIKFFAWTSGWSPEMVRAQVLTPVEEVALIGTARADPNSIMCYQIPGLITKDGKPILGGPDIDASDYAFIAKLYPKPA